MIDHKNRPFRPKGDQQFSHSLRSKQPSSNSSKVSAGRCERANAVATVLAQPCYTGISSDLYAELLSGNALLPKPLLVIFVRRRHHAGFNFA
ncbi:hypothetical protein [Rheinheimera sp. F8]|uniref:hypothetical protein n=1 Tax=Rheinheimera sp. F8 TaxID=1763998 RepID=UPI000744C2D3|nr:hypothetical protein [Rheinheimera sp. F8]ALZ75871.1 hypothetical protein ATY27_08905 [Rheinheimera sp. F8]